MSGRSQLATACKAQQLRQRASFQPLFWPNGTERPPTAEDDRIRSRGLPISLERVVASSGDGKFGIGQCFEAPKIRRARLSLFADAELTAAARVNPPHHASFVLPAGRPAERFPSLDSL